MCHGGGSSNIFLIICSTICLKGRRMIDSVFFYRFALLLSAFWFFFDSFLRGKSKFPSKSVRCEGVEFEFSILCDVCAIVRVCMSWFHLKTRFHVTLVLSICVLHGKRVVASGIGMFVFVWCVCFVLRLHVTHVVFYFVRRLCSSPCLHVMVQTWSLFGFRKYSAMYLYTMYTHTASILAHIGTISSFQLVAQPLRSRCGSAAAGCVTLTSQTRWDFLQVWVLQTR